MIIILDGLEGTGKSTAAKVIGERLCAPTYRAFRSDSDDHFTGSPLENTLKALKMPFNTYVEDLFLADSLTKTLGHGSVILDRSMPSAVAYGTLHKDWTEAAAWAGHDLWNKILFDSRMDVRYFYFRCDSEVAVKRTARRARPLEADLHLEGMLGRCWRNHLGRKHMIDTTHMTLANMAEILIKEIK